MWTSSACSRSRPRNCSRFARPAFTLIELLVVIGLIGLLVAIVLPIIVGVRDRSRTARCLSNLRAIGHAILIYSGDGRGRLPPADLRDPAFEHPPGNWATILVLGNYLSVPDAATGTARDSVLRCPSGIDVNGFDVDAYDAPRTSGLQAGYWQRQTGTLAPDGTMVGGITVRTWYGINAEYQDGKDYPMFRFPSESKRTELHMLTRIRNQATMALIYDGFFHHDRQANLMGNARHLKGTATNYLFADGHADTILTKDLPVSFADADLAARPFPRFKLEQQ